MAQEPNGEIAPLDGNLDIEFNNLLNKPFSVYIHVPYCKKRCGYCDFNTYTPNELDVNDQIDSWAEATVKEIKLAKKVLKEYLVIDTIFFGGGTPSLIGNNELSYVLNTLKENFYFANDLEITLEANPDDINDEKIEIWQENDINRISIGMQSSSKKVLQILDRTHDQLNIEKSAKLLRKHGFSNFSFDLIYGTPGESLEEWQESLEFALSLNPTHLSAYSLVIEPGTKMGNDLKTNKIQKVNDDLVADKYLLADEILENHGFKWYEISNWSFNNLKSRHNLNYWQNNNWWGFGPGAHSHIEGNRWWNLKLPNQWRERLENNYSPAKAREILTSEQKLSENIMLSLRLNSGLDSTQFSSGIINDLIKDGLIYLNERNLVLTKRGRLLADQVFLQLSN
ncbi:MAG: radical SAM family heme chaperone HemW [Candidatus Nanopelagicales bacterium]|nr:coproporphyrinogen III oxidase [Actinomycetota bacterium]